VFDTKTQRKEKKPEETKKERKNEKERKEEGGETYTEAKEEGGLCRCFFGMLVLVRIAEPLI
jgi:hypothetical protein